MGSTQIKLHPYRIAVRKPILSRHFGNELRHDVGLDDLEGESAIGARDRRWAMRLRMGKSGDGETGSGAVGRRGGARASEQRGDDEKSCHRRPVVRSTGSPGPHQVPEPSSAEEDG